MAGKFARATWRGVGNIKNLVNNVYSMYLGNKLEDVFTDPDTKEVLGLGKKPDTSKDSGFDKSKGTGKQDLNKQPRPYYEPPQMGGKDSNAYKTSDEQDTQEFGYTPTTPPIQENPQTNQGNAPSGVESYQQGIIDKNNALKTGNEQLIKRYLDYYRKAGKFGEVGQKFQGDATNMLQYGIKKPEEIPQYDTKQMQTDADGYAFEMKWNGKSFVKVPVNGADGKPMRIKSDDFEKQVHRDKMDLENRQLEHKITYDDAMLEIKQMLADSKVSKDANTGNGKGNSNGKSDGTVSPDGSDYVITDEQGKEIELEMRQMPVTDNFGLQKTNPDGTPMFTAKRFIKGTNTPASDVYGDYKGLYSKKNDTRKKYQKGLEFKEYGVTTKNKRKEVKTKVQGTIKKMLDKMTKEQQDKWIAKFGSLLQE